MIRNLLTLGIDTVQSVKKHYNDQFIKNSTIRNSINEYLDEEAKFAKSAITVIQTINQEVTKKSKR